MHEGAGTKTLGMFSALLNNSSEFVMKGVKNLVPKKHNLPVTKVCSLVKNNAAVLTTLQMVDQLIDSRQTMTSVLGGTTFDSNDYHYFDPKLMHAPSKEYVFFDIFLTHCLHFESADIGTRSTCTGRDRVCRWWRQLHRIPKCA